MSKPAASYEVLMNEMQNSALFVKVHEAVESAFDQNPERNQVSQDAQVEPGFSLMKELSSSATRPGQNPAHDSFLKKERENLEMEMKKEVEVERTELEIIRLNREHGILLGRLSKLEKAVKENQTKAFGLKGCFPFMQQRSTSQEVTTLVPRNVPKKQVSFSPNLVETSTNGGSGRMLEVVVGTPAPRVIPGGRQLGIVSMAKKYLVEFVTALGGFCCLAFGCICGTVGDVLE